MHIFSRVATMIAVAMSIGIATPVFAESAPVYDADSMPQQFDNGPDQSQDLPPPPAPSQEGAFVPNQLPAASSSNAMSSTESSPPSGSPEQRLRRVEQQIQNMQNNDAAARVDSLQNQVESLRNQVEQLTHQLQQVQNQQKSQYADLDKRLAQQGTKANQPAPATDTQTASDDILTPAAMPAKSNHKAKSNPKTPAASDTVAAADASKADNADDHSAAKSASQPNVAEEQQIYQTAYNLIKAKKYNDAVDTLQKMLQKYPSGQFASNAHYWLGELYGLMGKNDQALTEFDTVVRVYPTSPRVSDAQLKVGLIYSAQSKWTEAKAAFKRVINHYPGTAPARLASEQLKQIRQAGH